MSAVSSEAPQSADLSEAKPSSPAAGAGGGAPHEYSGDGGASKDFGPNEWLVDELYQRYLADPGSVDMAWWNFFADYTPPVGSVAARAAREQGQPDQAAAPGQGARPGCGPGERSAEARRGSGSCYGSRCRAPRSGGRACDQAARRGRPD